MTLFIGLHDMGEGVTDEMVEKSWEAYKVACTQLGCSPKHAHYSAAAGKAFCLTEANSAAEVQQAHDNANVAVSEIIEVSDLE